MNRDVICMKMKLMKNIKKWQFFILMKGICTRNYKGFCVAVNKSYVPFTRKFPMVMHFVLILHKCCRSSKIIFMSLITTKQVRNTVKVSALNSVYLQRNSQKSDS